MRILHTSDWHLGHTLRGEVARDHEHQAFLAWLLATCVREAPDVLLITGDVFDSATPTASAERMWFEFLAAARRAHPMEIIAIAGNHDSPARLGASSSVLRELGVHVIGSLPRRADGAIDLERVLIPVAAGRGLVAAVPFLRPVDLGAQDDALEAVYGEVLAGARARRGRHQALIATGHLYVAGADAQFLSERRVSVGGQESAPLRLFPDDLSYVALGHVHRAQRVGRETIRYAGAPIPLALDEASYRHQVVVADFAGDRAVEIRAVPIPRAVEIVRVPKRGAAPLPAVLAALSALPPLGEAAADPARPYLEVVVALERPEPRLRALVEAALEGKRARLVRIGVETTGDHAALADRIGPARRLAELDPREVFVRLWARDHAEPPDAAVLAAFDRLLAEVRGDLADPAAPPEEPAEAFVS
ncbi:MAG: exonuclease SbcCD subunit D C-terminal domain-containing protein [Deltaproteobacteria bacterium]|nr:exonuclease SbcCD subunit D C-terminal domain-containing protein [Deltaproteobacteria bacterium]